ncbi:hypothetical protein ABS767_16585 [Sphingomonas sp. ST-64]|uniref:Uncharacterized protein n=1 Tax=Sphingomonas plantiphila TaxID=3163295 RepID=A0ABW8YQX5_9SPHN
MRVWLASLELALEPIFRSKLVLIAFLSAFCVVARFEVDDALKVPGVDSGAIFNAMAVAFLKTAAVAVALCAIWAVPAMIWTRLSIARSNRVKPKS